MIVEGIARRFGGLVEDAGGGAVVAVERRVDLDRLGPGRGSRHLALGPVAGSEAGQTEVFLDIETTGLRAGAGTLVALVGLAWVEGREAVVRQYVLHDPAAEPAWLRRIDGWLRRSNRLITFNGKRFDQPMLLNRFLLHRLGDPFPADHLDLLHPARRIWGRRLRHTSLGALEDRVLGMPRAGDVPGAEVPARFFAFVRGGDADYFAPVLDHNRQDLVSLILLAAHVGHLVTAQPGPGAAPSDLLGLGGLCEATGRWEQAQRCYEGALAGALPSERTEALFRLAGLLQRNGEAERAIALYEGIAAGSGRWAFPSAIEGAKLAEHTRREPAQALGFARQALQIAASTTGPLTDRHLPAVLRRIARLERKVEQNTPI